MKINILYSLEDADQATGLVVVIDVFRAFSTACYLFAAGVKKIIPVADIDLAYQLKKENPEFILVGERNGKIQPGFDFGNSPWQIRDFDWKDKTIIHTTTSGTQGIIKAKEAKEIITGSFVNAQAIVNYINNKKPEAVSFICTYTANEHIANEDLLCARYLKKALLKEKNDFNKTVENLKRDGFANHFFDPGIISHPVEDFDLCMQLDKFNFVLEAHGKKEGEISLVKIDL
jgi:2-phosphosulfolactate phosphatase